jgi:hypothetical protein
MATMANTADLVKLTGTDWGLPMGTDMSKRPDLPPLKEMKEPQQFADALQQALLPILEIHQEASNKGFVPAFQLGVNNGRWVISAIQITQTYYKS